MTILFYKKKKKKKKKQFLFKKKKKKKKKLEYTIKTISLDTIRMLHRIVSISTHIHRYL